MEKPKILITGATGATGAPSVEMLLQMGFPVRALVHKEDERSNRLKALGAEIVVGDMQNMDDVRLAWQGATRGYFCYPLSPDLVDVTVIFAQAAKEAGAEFIVNMSQKQVAPGVKSPATIRHFLSEEVFNWTGIPTTHLRPTFFSEWFLYLTSQIKADKLQMAFPKETQHAPVAGEDLARTIVSILADPEQHIGKVHQLFGPEMLSYTEIGEIIGKTLGKDIAYEQVSIQEMADSIGWGGYAHFKNHIANVERDNVFGLPNFNNTIEDITGIRPMTLAAFIDKNRAAFTN
ncbi:NmrA family NAD(P)-binding protein [Mucilaginibacter aquaedulcis]|uniref:NmrA family NAD(P)-binding protein n=1 Tax=Mucilaginibacter aquaedulcis TaxID=1187081 RepID=UPI0025B5C80B|nr:NmrA family NAD(P)-binding protein [Mucilaginibacter aquaedulcis]MDN3548881.1 NmrA family NAD(P)-binding protein [Mucilaginibacter aquaedulcis]